MKAWPAATASAASKRAPAWHPARLATLTVGLIAFIGPLRPREDPDSWWHLATGRLILETGSIPSTDPFSWTARGRPWIAHEWLSELLFGLIDRLGGPGGLLLLAGLLIGGAFLLLHRTLRRITSNDWIIAVCLAIALYLSTITWTIRPHLFSVLFFAFFLDFLVAYRLQQRRRGIWWLVPATVLWANLHGAFVSGLILLWIFALIPLLERRRDAKPLVLVGLLATLAGAATPNGLDIYSHVLHVANASTPFVEEWQPPGLGDFYDIVFTIVMVLAPVALALSRRRDHVLLASAITFGVLGAGAVKNVWLAGITAAPAFAWALDRWGRVPISHPRLGFERRALQAVFGVFLIGAVGIALNLSRAGERHLRQEGTFPIAAAEALDTRPRGRLVNPYNWGGYLIWKTPQFPVAIDGRNDMYSPTQLNDAARLAYLGPGWRDYLDDNHVRYVLWQRGGALAEALRLLPEWRVVFVDDRSILFERD